MRAKEKASDCSEAFSFSVALTGWIVIHLFACVDILNAIALILEGVREVEVLPATVLALIFIRRRTDLRIAGVKDSIIIRIGYRRSAEGSEVNDAVRVNHFIPRAAGIAW